MQKDIVIVGAGPAGIFTALELLKLQSNRKITIFEKGRAVENRSCPKTKVGHCVNCKNCNITTGFSGAGAFSDGKLSLSPDVGGELPDLVGRDKIAETIAYTDQIYLEFGADTRIEGVGNPDKIKDIRRKAISANLTLVDCPIRHLGTEKAQQLYYEIEKYLLNGGVELVFNTDVKDLIVENNECKGVIITENGVDVPYYANKTIVATGRRGANWLETACETYNVKHRPGTVDIGVRVECRNEIMEEINNVLYEGKLVGHPKPFKNKVRTFCQNPGGYVAQENYDNDLAVVNGHSFKDKKSQNTNLSILCSHNFTTPFNQPIAYATMVGKLTNMLAGGKILVQRFGDILDGKRTWPKELSEGNVKPSLPDAVAGDITSAMPYRAMISILNFIQDVDKVVPGFASGETLLYSPELKFYSNKIDMDTHFNTSVKNLHCLGDSCGWTRGLMMASVMGVLMARELAQTQK